MKKLIYATGYRYGRGSMRVDWFCRNTSNGETLAERALERQMTYRR